jgi:hypothetical protein
MTTAEKKTKKKKSEGGDTTKIKKTKKTKKSDPEKENISVVSAFLYDAWRFLIFLECTFNNSISFKLNFYCFGDSIENKLG